jgi:hypothetical protein
MRKAVIVGLIGVLCLLGCKTDMEPYEAGNRTSARKVLVVAEDSEFKRDVVATVIERLGTQDWYFSVVGLDQLARVDTGQFGAILLVCSVRGGRLDERASAYLERDPTNAKAVLLFTCGVDGPVPELRDKLDLRVDAVSSASRDDRVSVRAEEVAALLEKRF